LDSRPILRASDGCWSALIPTFIVYRVTEDAVIVQRVRHAARDPSGAPRRA
jgi:hypothetical protein